MGMLITAIYFLKVGLLLVKKCFLLKNTYNKNRINNRVENFLITKVAAIILIEYKKILLRINQFLLEGYFYVT